MVRARSVSTLAADAPADDRAWMQLALQQARDAAAAGEVPVGAVLVHEGRALALAHNGPVSLNDPTAHAEMLALREGARRLGNYRLEDCALYVTLEPCAMCAQALLHARVDRVVYGAREPRTGAAGSVIDLFGIAALNSHTQVQGGVLADDCATLLQDFFRSRREQARADAEPLRDDALRTPEACFDGVDDHWPALRAWHRHLRGLPSADGLRLHLMDSQADALSPSAATDGHANAQAAADAPTATLWLHSPAGYWPELASGALACQHSGRQLIPDLMGFGQSDKPKKPGWHRLARHAAVLLEALQALGVRQFDLRHAPGQAELAQTLADAAGQGAHGPRCLSQAPAAQGLHWQPLTPEMAARPFPDAGHRAGPRAWRDAGWR